MLVKSKKYPNLYRDSESLIFQFRKYSSLKKKQFFASTKEKKSEAKAYQAGLKAFNEWIGSKGDQVEVLFSTYAESYLEKKLLDPRLSENTKRSFRNQVKKHLIPAFGSSHLKMIRNAEWSAWANDRIATHPCKLFNARKALSEILRSALEEGLIEKIPHLENFDPPVSVGRCLKKHEMTRLLWRAHRPLRLLCFIMWKMGARPGEILKWKWSMIAWNESEHGKIYIPKEITKTRRARAIPLNPKVSDLLKRRQAHSKSPFLFHLKWDLGQPLKSYQTAWEQACRRSNTDATIYDFRRTFLTEAIVAGLSETYVAKYADTSPQMIRRFYAKDHEETFQKISEDR